MNKHLLLIAFSGCLTLSACSSLISNIPGVYSLDIKQGNIIEQSMIDQLRPNMTKRQVLYIMGSPMLTDAFHDKRWDYLFSEQLSGESRVQKRISLYFNGDNLVGIQGDFRPSAVPATKEAAETTVEVPKRNLERSMAEKITGLFSSESPEPVHTEQPDKTEQSAKPNDDKSKSE